jgi:hypothetical protein
LRAVIVIAQAIKHAAAAAAAPALHARPAAAPAYTRLCVQ